MATHNQVRVVGFLLNDPHIVNEGMQGAERIVYQVRTVHRDLDGFNGAKFQDLVVFYAGEEYMERMKKLQKYDLVEEIQMSRMWFPEHEMEWTGYIYLPDPFYKNQWLTNSI